MPIDAPQTPPDEQTAIRLGCAALARIAAVNGPDRMAAALARFWARVDRSGNCWIWQGNPQGFTLAGPGKDRDRVRVTIRPVDLAWYASRKVPAPSVPWRTCGTPGCVRPKHLQIG